VTIKTYFCAQVVIQERGKNVTAEKLLLMNNNLAVSFGSLKKETSYLVKVKYSAKEDFTLSKAKLWLYIL